MRGLVLVNGRVFTARPGEPPFDGGVAIVGERIIAVGGDAAVRAMAPPGCPRGSTSTVARSCRASSTRTTTSPSPAPSSPSVDVRYPGVASIADLVARIAEVAERTPDGAWIRAVGVNPEQFPDGRLPTRWDLDEATRVHPVLVQHMSGHHALANTLALQQRGVGEDAADPPAVDSSATTKAG